MSDFDDYQTAARETAVYPWHLSCIYPTLGLCGEAGEVAEKVKKIHRDKHGTPDQSDLEAIEKELGDVLWYLSNIASDMNLSLDHIAKLNLEKLAARAARGVLHGSGDDR